jgi:hypothetical protein
MWTRFHVIGKRGPVTLLVLSSSLCILFCPIFSNLQHATNFSFYKVSTQDLSSYGSFQSILAPSILERSLQCSRFPRKFQTMFVRPIRMRVENYWFPFSLYNRNRKRNERVPFFRPFRSFSVTFSSVPHGSNIHWFRSVDSTNSEFPFIHLIILNIVWK